jgi:hypothetical protein
MSGAILDAFAGAGAVHVPGAVPRAVADAVRAAAERVLRERDERAAAGRLPPELADAQVRRFVRLDELPLGFDAAAELIRPAFRELARGYLAAEPRLDPNSHVREIRAGRADAHLPFHQDQTIMGRSLVNVWIALDPCGRDAPGLEVVRGSWRTLLEPSPPDGARFAVEKARLAEAEVLRAFGAEALWHPVFEPAMARDRMSVELRLLSWVHVP